MNRSFLLIMVGAVAFAILVAVVLQSKLSPKGGSAPSTTEILVANKKLAVGQILKPEDVRWQAWPESALFKGVIRKSEQKDEKKLSVYGTPLRRAVEVSEPVTNQAVISDVKGSNNFLAASLAPGMRAVGIAVKPNTSVGGFLSPGDYVDVILSYSPKMSGDMQNYSVDVVQRYASQTVLRNVRILAVDQESKDEERAAKIAKTITLEVSKEGAEILAMATSMGELSLALRRMGEQEDAKDKAKPLITDMNTIDVLKKVSKIMDRSKTDSSVVRLYGGTTIENIPVRPAAAAESER